MSKFNANFQKFKTVVKKYWYIAIPVHLGTSACWFGTFYGATKAGLDFVPALEKTSLPQKYIDPLKRGNIGNFAQALVLYKLVTPFRYASTLAVTRSAIKYMRARDLIK
jgi:hypothetical protein